MPPISNPRRERIALLAGTLAMALLLIGEARWTPPALLWALPPYLVLVGWSLRPRGDRGEPDRIPLPSDKAEPSGPGLPEIAPLPPDPEPSPDRPPAVVARPRRRARPRVVAEPAPAAWVEVAPGRFVRGEIPEPPPMAEAPETDPSDRGESAGIVEVADAEAAKAPEGI